MSKDVALALAEAMFNRDRNDRSLNGNDAKAILGIVFDEIEASGGVSFSENAIEAALKTAGYTRDRLTRERGY